jgi:hypothetical protein
MKRAVLGAVLLLWVIALVGTFAAESGSASPHQPQGQGSAPPSGKPANGTVRFAALGDVGTGDKNQMAIARQMVKYHDERPYDTVLMLGDNIYGDGDPAKLPLLQPLAIAVIGGLAVALLLSLIVTPTVYATLKRTA